jgi:GrpB-like predicted nucleotidyltransferase (UPF0157 family)
VSLGAVRSLPISISTRREKHVSGSEQVTTIHLVSYDSDWAVMFSQLARQIHQTLGEKVLLLEHVGSTSVPGLCAKPVIDVVLAVENSADEAAYLPPLGTVGITMQFREPEWFEHRLLRASVIQTNIHVFTAGCEEIGRMLLFRDWLREREDERRRYERAKRGLALRTWKDVQAYADAKSEIVTAILSRAALFRKDSV